MKQNHENAYQLKPQHGMVIRKQKGTEGYDEQSTNAWLSKVEMQSHTEGYICAIQEQEIYTKALKARREHPTDSNADKSCRHCHKSKEDIFHLLCSCEALSASLYLPVRHNEGAKIIYNSIIKLHHPDEQYTKPRYMEKQ